MGINLSGIGTLLRRGIDDVGSAITGQPAQSNPAPAAPTPAPQPQAQAAQQSPLAHQLPPQFLNNNPQLPTNGNAGMPNVYKAKSFIPFANPNIAAQTLPQNQMPKAILPSSMATVPSGGNINEAAINPNVHPPAMVNVPWSSSQVPYAQSLHGPPAPPMPPPHPGASILHDLTHNPVTNFIGAAGNDIGNAAFQTGKGIGQIASIPYNAGKVDIGELTGNQQATNNAATALSRDLGTGAQFLQFAPRAVIQLRNSAAEGLGGNGGNQQLSNFVPHPGWEQTVLGSQPIPSFQQTYKDVSSQQGTQHAVIQTGLQAAMDALAFKGGIDSATKLGTKGVDLASKVAPLNEDGAIPNPFQQKFNGLPSHQVIMDTSKLNTLNNAKDTLTVGKPLDQGTVEGLHQIKNDNGLDFISGSPADRRQRISQYLEQNGEAIPRLQNGQADSLIPQLSPLNQGGYIKVPGNYDPEAEDAARSAAKPETQSERNQAISDMQKAGLPKNLVDEYASTPLNRGAGKEEESLQPHNLESSSEGSIAPPALKILQDNPKLMAQAKKLDAMEATKVGTNSEAYARLSDKHDADMANAATQSTELQPRSQKSGIALSKPSEPSEAQILQSLGSDPKDIPGLLEHERSLAQPKEVPKNEPVKLSRQERQAIIKNNESQTPIKQIDLKTAKDNIKGAIAEAVGTSADERAMYDKIDRLQHKLSPQDRDLMYRYDNGEDLNALAKEAQKPKQFLKAATSARDALDHSLGIDRTAGGVTLRQKNYIPHSYQATPEVMDQLGIEPDQRFHIGPYSGFHDTVAKYPSYMEAAKQTGGLLKPLHENPFDPILDYGHGAANAHEGDLLKQALMKAVPNDIGELSDTRIGDEKLHAAPGDLPFAATDRVIHQLNGYREQAHINNMAVRLLGKGYDAANALQKKLLFSLAWFHQVNISLKYAAATIGSGHAKLLGQGISEAILSGIHPKIAEALNKKYIADGTADWQRENGVIHGVQQARYRVGTDDGIKDKIAIANERFNPLDMMHRSMGNFINAYSNVLSQFAKDHVPSGTPEATALAQEYNALLGHIDAKISNLSPFVAQTVRRGGLAPQFLLSQGKLLKDAAIGTKGAAYAKTGLGLSNATDVARTAVIGNRIVNTAIGAAITYIASGQMPTFQNLLQRGGITGGFTGPNYDVNEKNAKGEKQVEYLPTDYAGLFENAIKNPQHFGASRYSPALSAIERYATNKDWNGNQLADPNAPNFQEKRIEGAAKGFLPIGAQNLTNSNLSNTQKVEQEFGSRAHTNPNDPQVQSQQKYFNQQTQYANDIKSGNFGAINPTLAGMDPKSAAYWSSQLKAYQDLNPGKDINGVENSSQWNALSSQQKDSFLLMNNPKGGGQTLSPIFYIQQQQIQSDPSRPHNPLYDLSGNDGVGFTLDKDGNVTGTQSQPRAQTALDYQKSDDPTQKSLIMAANPWLSDYEKQVGNYSQNYKPIMTQYMQGQGWNQKAIDQYWTDHPNNPSPIQSAVTPDQQKLMDQYSSITDPTAKSDFFNNNTKELSAAFGAAAVYSAKDAVAKGGLPQQQYPTPSPEVATLLNQMQKNPNHDKAIGKANALLIQNNPQLNQYLADIGIYGLAKDAARYQYQDPAHPGLNAGQLLNLGRPIDQTTLKGISNVASYDIGKNANGQYSFMGAGGAGKLGAGATSGSGSGGSKKSSKIKIYNHKVRPIKIHHPKRSYHTRSHSLKTPYSNIAFKNNSKKTLRIADDSISHVKMG